MLASISDEDWNNDRYRLFSKGGCFFCGQQEKYAILWTRDDAVYTACQTCASQPYVMEQVLSPHNKSARFWRSILFNPNLSRMTVTYHPTDQWPCRFCGAPSPYPGLEVCEDHRLKEAMV